MSTKTTPTSLTGKDQLAKSNNNTLSDENKLSNQPDNASTETKGNTPTEQAVPSSASMPSRLSTKQKKANLEEYRSLFLETPKITDRKTVFISGKLRDLLDEIARKLGDRKMSVSGLLENMARHHLQTYEEDLEMWKKL
ncbi:DUF3408 domain-containing protein [Dysgonomonas sp. HDW5B]|uniref:DUF3408 domain-containing protein n=1 Tax=Dysgonomonas sp. HDW5B TaxID=2714927 RepID=UPI00140B9086|nr:DUF3408 domain-containing protein [Dysgonomonas sp. HDW5B]QIK53127.1 DUF3408 domain-containing protein [Dysgonomonas sp. HDW5B]